MTGKDEMITTYEAAKRLGISARRVRKLIKDGRLPASKFGTSWMINAKDLTLVEHRPTGVHRTRKT